MLRCLLLIAHSLCLDQVEVRDQLYERSFPAFLSGTFPWLEKPWQEAPTGLCLNGYIVLFQGSQIGFHFCPLN